MKTDYHLDAYQLVWYFPKHYFDCIISDPPWSIRKAVEKYKGNKHMKTYRFRDSVDYLLLPVGIFSEVGYNSTGILGYNKIDIGVLDTDSMCTDG